MGEYWQFNIVHLIDVQKGRKAVEAVKERAEPFSCGAVNQGCRCF